jgi:RHS repeat-associated protein
MFAAMRLYVAVFILVFFAGAATCQVSTSNYAYGTFDNKGFDTINVGNLNTHFSIPVINKPGRGQSFNYNLSYDSSVWFPATVNGQMVWTPVQNFGWRGDTEIATGYLSFFTTSVTEPGPGGTEPSPGCLVETHSSFVYHDTFGIAHPFPKIITVLASGSSCTISPVSTGTEVASDGSGYTLNVTDTTTGTITSANGKAIAVPNVNNGAATATDSNGNQISVDGTGDFTDTLGTTVLTVAGTAPTAHTFQYTNPEGTKSTVTMKYTTFTVATDFDVSVGGTRITEFGPTATPLVTSVELADGSTYTFTYESTPGSCTPLSGTDSSGCVTGRIASVSLPTGGTISYSYTGGSNGIETDGSASGLNRTDDTGAMWSYTRGTPSKALGPGAAWTTTIMAPEQNSTRNTYVASFSEDSGSTNNPYLTQEQFYQGSNSPSNLLQTTIQCYNANYASCAGATISTPFTQVDTYKELPSGSARLSEVLYNTYGLVTDDREYNYGVTLGAAPSSASIISETTTSFNGVTSSGIASEVATQVVYNGSSATAEKLSSATFTYDGVATTTTTGTPQHIVISGGNGNLTKATYMTGNTFGPLAYNYTYYDTGNPNTVTGVNGAVTTYVYGSSSCGNSFPTLIEEPLGLSRSIVWNCTGGVSMQVTDENGNPTTASYTDANFWRPTQTTDQANNATTISYHGATSVESSLLFNSGGSVSDVLTTLDGYGRPAYTQKRQGPGATDFDTTEVDYNSTGQADRTTLPYSSAASPSSSNASAPATTKTFDALGRVLTITKGDNGTISYTYTNNDVLQTVSGSQAFKKQLEYDGMGRLTSVCEISSSLPGVVACGQGVSQNGYLTKYTYDGLGHLLTVTQNAQASGSTQTRSFVYDLMGRMTSETDPETGTFHYFWDTYPSGCNFATTVNFPGNLAATEDNSGVFLCAAYDQRNRLTGYGNNATKTNCRGFVYDTATNTPPAGLSNTKGRLLEAYTNSTCDGHNDVVTDEFFSYSVRGEMTDVYESTPGSNGFYHSNSSYYPTGAVETLTIPGIPTVTYGGLDGEGRYTTVNMSSGSLVSSATYSTSSSGNALGALTGITFGSGNTESFSTNPSTGRETNYTVNIGGAADSATLTWNTNGTLGQLAIADNVPGTGDSQTCTYGYDDLKRISSVNCGALWGQTFTYDAFGNISKNVPSGSAGLIFNPTYNTSSNRLSTLPSGASPMYDTNGRLLQDNLNSYTWDNYGDMVTANNGSTTVTAIYDAFGRMVQSSQDGEFIWTPVGQSFTALASGQTTEAAQIPLLGGAIAFYGPSGAIFYRFPDHLGNARIDSKPSGAFFSANAYGPFGEQYATSGAGDGAFTGYQQDEFTDGLYDFPFRKLSSSQGRWISPDPKGVSAVKITNPQSWNRYAYVLNNPLSLVDPAGLEEDEGGDCADDDSCDDGGGGGGGGDGTGGGGSPSDGISDGFTIVMYGFATPIYDPNVVTEVDPGLDFFGFGQLNAFAAIGTPGIPNYAPNNPNCSGSNAQLVANASIAALSQLNPTQDETNNITPRDGNFANVANPALINTNIWTNAASAHGSSLQSPTIPGQNIFVVKLYNDPNRGNIIAVVYPNGTLAHMQGLIPFLAGSTSVNVPAARAYLGCPAH